jgi:hypothetical protein
VDEGEREGGGDEHDHGSSCKSFAAKEGYDTRKPCISHGFFLSSSLWIPQDNEMVNPINTLKPVLLKHQASPPFSGHLIRRWCRY